MKAHFIFATLASVACGGADQPARVPETTTTSTTVVAPDAVPMTPTDNVASINSPMPTQVQPPEASFSDAQIAAITDAANSGEVEQARVALRHSTNAHVKAFAQMMIDHHSQAKRSQQMLMSSMNVAPQPTPLAIKIETDTKSAISSLSAISGNDFDKAYIDLQVKEHKDVLDTLDTKLIPSAHSAELKKALIDFRPKVADHLQRAQDLQQVLSKP